MAGALSLPALLERRRLQADAVYQYVFGLWLLWWVRTRVGEPLEL